MGALYDSVTSRSTGRSRREFLAIAGLIVPISIAGCIDLGDNGEDVNGSQEPTPTPDQDTSPDDVGTQLTMSIEDHTVSVDDVVEVAIAITSAEEHSVRGIEVGLEFDPSILGFIDVSGGSFGNFVINDEDASDGVVIFNAIDLDGHETPLEAAAIVEFEALAAGESPLTLLADHSNVSIEDSEATVYHENGSVTVTE